MVELTDIERRATHLPMTRSENMARIRSRDTAPEFLVRRAAHALGFRFRLYRKDLPGVPDLVFPRFSAVIFVHGCFWHQHSDPLCRAGRSPKSNLDYWGPKLARNCARDAENISKLRGLGWKVLVIWECQTKDYESLQNRISRFLREGCDCE